MEEIFGSESGSGCESGWTLYLEHSMYHPSQCLQNHNNGDDFDRKKGSFTREFEEEEEEEEDTSMVSDASSGPQHFQEQEDECCFKFNNNGGAYINGNRQKTPKEPTLHRKIQDLPSFLDDTASSPFFSFSNNNLTVPSKKASMEENNIIDYSQGYSTTYFERKSRFPDQFGLFRPSVSGTRLQENQWFEGKRWGRRS